MSHPIEKITIDELFNQHDGVVDNVTSRREKLIAKLESTIDELSVGGDDGASMLEAKVSLINAYNQILKGQENSYTDKVKLRLQDKRLEAVKDVQQQVTEILKRVSINNIRGSNSAVIGDVDNEIGNIASTQCDPISEEELTVVDE